MPRCYQHKLDASVNRQLTPNSSAQKCKNENPFSTQTPICIVAHPGVRLGMEGVEEGACDEGIWPYWGG